MGSTYALTRSEFSSIALSVTPTIRSLILAWMVRSSSYSDRNIPTLPEHCFRRLFARE